VPRNEYRIMLPFADAEPTAHNAARIAITMVLRIGGTSVSGWETDVKKIPARGQACVRAS
jgi:hypothetical protein